MDRLLLTLLAFALLATNAFTQDAPPATDLSAVAPQLKSAARRRFEAAESSKAHEYLESLLELYRAEHRNAPSWRGTYQWSRRLAEVAHEYLRAGQFNDALAIMGEAADLDVPLRNGFDNGLASIAGGLHRHLATLDSAERYELLHAWSMPTESRQTVRVLESFVPMTGPPPAFSRVFGQRPRDTSFPIAQVGDVSGLFSTAWELVKAAEEAGRLRKLTAELETLAERRVANARHVLMLAKIINAKTPDEKLTADLTQLLNLLRDNSPRPTDRSDTGSFHGAWRYGYGKFDLVSEKTLDFSPYAVWSGAAWQMSADRPHKNPEFDFLRTDRTGGHPSHVYACIHRWVAPADGVASITGTMQHPTPQGDGVRGRAVSSRLGLRGEWISRNGATETKVDSIEVKAGDTIDLAVDMINGTHFDSFIWIFQLHLETSEGTRIYDSVDDFCGPSDTHLLSDAVLAAVCLGQPAFQPLGASIFEKLLENTCDSDSWLNRPHESDSILIRPVLRRAWATAVRKRFGDTESNLLDEAELGLWVPNSGLTSAQHAVGHARQSWLAVDGQLVHLAGPGNDFLLFKYPLTGDFTFTVEAQFGGRPATNGAIAYGGLTYQIDSTGRLLTVSDLEGRNEIVRPCPHVLASVFAVGKYAGQPMFNRLALGSTTGRMTFVNNDQLVWNEPVSNAASPWLALRAWGDCTPVFRNLRITGQPIIPREILLTEGDLLRGWSSGYYGERMPSPLQELQHLAASFSADRSAAGGVYSNYFVPELIAGLAGEHSTETRPGRSAIGPDGASVEHDWFATGGILHGTRREPANAAIAQSRLYYFRPLLDGEAIHYEFQYQPGKVEVHPALGRLAFLIEPGGVRLHWMTDGEREWTGLAEDNAVVEPFDRRGPKPLPLVPEVWNRMAVALADDRVTLTLNEQVIYQRKIDPGAERTFGFYHDACRSAVQVRNVVMRGDWPEQLTPEQQADLGAVSLVNRSAADRLVLNQLLQDRYLAPNSLDIARRARSLPGNQRYEYLAGWVLSGNSRSPIRMQGTFAPLPAPPLEHEPLLGTPSPNASAPVESSRIQVGTQLIAPAIDFVTLAQQLGRLDDIRSRLTALDNTALDIATDKKAQSQRQALLALVNIAEEDFEAAKQNLGSLVEALDDGAATDSLDHWPETLAVWVALRHPETEEPARELLDVMYEHVRTRRLGETEAWKHHITALATESRFRRELAAFGQAVIEQPLSQWQPASHLTASSRGQGFPDARWQRLPHRVDNVSAHQCDYLYFQSPLRGDFEVECDVASSFGWRVGQLMYAGFWTRPWGDLAQFGFGSMRDQRMEGNLLPVQPPFTHPGDWMRYRIAVRDGRMKVSGNGLLIHQQSLPEGYDPWLAIRSQWLLRAAVRDVRISGEPVIPSAVDLTASADLSLWLPYFDESVGGFNQDWHYTNGELIGQRRASPAAAGRESLLRYHRPMFEDGTIEYEFYYDSERAHVHPALDRLALLLEPEGVRVHWITDGMHDRTGLDPVNVFDEPKNRRGAGRLPLVAGDWNKLRLALSGDTVAITLNDQLVYERKLEATNLRTFGLFHNANQTQARLRNIVWRGNWPRELPRLAQQELADVSTIEMLQEKLPELTEAIEIDFARQGLPRELLCPRSPDKENLSRDVTVEPDGVHVTSKATEQGNQYSYLGSLFRVGGDFDITASFDGLDTTVVSPVGTASIVWVSAVFENSANDHVALLRKHEGNRQQRLHVFHQWGPPDQKRHKDDGGVYDGRAGVLRLSRRGAKVYCLLAESEAGPFRLIEQREVSPGDLPPDGIKLLLEARDQAVATVVWTKLSVRAERITEKQFELFTALKPDRSAGQARYVRVDLPNKTEILSLAEVEVISGGKNVARGKPATQSSVQFDGVADRAVDGNRNGHYGQAQSTTHTAPDREPWWEVDLGQSYNIEEVLLWNRTEAGQDRLRGVRVQLLDEQRHLVWQQTTDSALTAENGDPT